MKKRVLSIFICLVLVLCAMPVSVSANGTNVIEDTVLLQALVNQGYDTNLDGTMSAEELADVFFLDITGLGVSSLSGLEYASGLSFLEASENNISDLSPLASLNIMSINLSYNNISGSFPTELTGMLLLESLDISHNELTDINGISNLESLSWLNASYNFISDISELQQLSALSSLNVQYNRLSLDPSSDDYGVLDSFSSFSELRYAPQLMPSCAEDSIIEFDDSALLSALISNGIDVTGDDEVSVCELGCFYGSLDLSDSGISDISGIQYAVNASEINLSGNSISDLSPLSGLTALKSLNLNNNNISSASALSALTALTDISLAGNKLSNLNILSSLPLVENADFSRNNIADVSAVSGLTAIKNLNLSDNFISSVGSYLNSVSFATLDLSYNIIPDKSALTSISANTLNISFNNMNAADISPSEFTDVTNLIYSEQTEYSGSYRDEVAIPDAVLKSILLLQSGINANGDDVITKGELFNYSGTFDISDTEVSDITGLQYMKSLKTFRFNNTSVSDISPLSGMTRVQTVSGQGTQVSDISPIVGLKKLSILNFSDCKITSLAPLASNTLDSISSIVLTGNGITDASYLAYVPNVKALTLTNNKITDISFISSLTAPTYISLEHNRVLNPSVLQSPTTLTYLDISANYINIQSSFVNTVKANNPSINFKYDNQLSQISVTYTNKGEDYSVLMFFPGDKTQAIDAPVSVDTFLGWKVDSTMYQPGDTITVNGPIVLEAVWLVSKSYSVTINTTGDNFFELIMDDYNYGKQDSYSHQQSKVGTVYNVTAIEDEAEFLYWKNGNGKILSYNTNYSFTVTDPVSLTAVFNVTDDGFSYVSFLTDFDQELSRILYSKSASSIVIPPVSPEKYGYTFIGWSLDGNTAIEVSSLQSEIIAALQNGDVIVKPVYTKDDVYYTVTVNEGSGSGSYISSSVVEAVANAPQSGYKFAYWVNGNEDIVSYLSTYLFIAVGDVELTAVYVTSDSQIEETVILTITSKAYNSEANTVSFIAERFIPEKYTVLQTGIILTKNGDIGIDTDEFKIGASGVLKGTSSSTENRASYMVVKGSVIAEEIWYARAYAVCEDSFGAVEYFYGDIASIMAI